MSVSVRNITRYFASLHTQDAVQVYKNSAWQADGLEEADQVWCARDPRAVRACLAAVFTHPVISAQIIRGGMPLHAKCDSWVFDPHAERDHDLLTVLQYACRRRQHTYHKPGQPQLVDWIVKNAAPQGDARFYADMNAGRALLDACWYGNLKCAEILLHEGVRSLLPAFDQRFIIENAIESRFSQIVFVMSRHGFDLKEQWPADNSQAKAADVKSVMLRGSKGKSPLMLAALYGLPGLVKFCIEHGAEVDMEDADSETALTLAARG